MSRPSRRRFLASSVAAISAPLLLPAAPSSTAAAGKVRFALVGCGGQGRADLKNFLGCGDPCVALCDPDEKAMAAMKEDIGKSNSGGPEMAAGIKTYTDFRKLIENEKDFEAVIIATPDHWHAPLCTAFLKAGKHLYCEKPLTHSVGEARALRDLARHAKVVTQMGNQGGAGPSFRRSQELIQAGVLGQIRQVHIWLDGGGFPHDIDRPEGEDPLPPGFNWDAWVGPAPMRPYKTGIYHPAKWRGWRDFGSGQLGDIGCHSFNLPVRALELVLPSTVELIGEGWVNECYNHNNHLRYHAFSLAQKEYVDLHWYDGSVRPPQDLVQDVLTAYSRDPDPTRPGNLDARLPKGTLIIGQKGILFTNPWNNACTIKLKDEPRLKDVLHHEATKDIPEKLPRPKSHHAEFLDACRGIGKTCSDFDTGGLLTEFVLAGVVALRLKKTIDWDGPMMRVEKAAELGKDIIHPEYRTKWL